MWGLCPTHPRPASAQKQGKCQNLNKSKRKKPCSQWGREHGKEMDEGAWLISFTS